MFESTFKVSNKNVDCNIIIVYSVVKRRDLVKKYRPITAPLFVSCQCVFYSIDTIIVTDFVLKFADDAVLFSESKEGLQNSIDNSQLYFKKWNLIVNVDKPKIVVFRKGGQLRRDFKWTNDGNDIEIVQNFNYLGIVFSSGGSFVPATKELDISIEIMFNLFDTYVLSILNYNCEVWGFSKAENIERVHRKFCKWLLNVKMSTNSLSLYSELGRFPLYIER